MEYVIRAIVLFLIGIPIAVVSEIFAVKSNKIRSIIYGIIVGGVVAFLMPAAKIDIVAQLLIEYSYPIFIAEASLVVYYVYRKRRLMQGIFFAIMAVFALLAGILSLSRISAAGWLFVLGIIFIAEAIVTLQTA